MMTMKHLLLLAALALTGCMTKPVDVVPVRPISYVQVAPAPVQTGGSLFAAARYRPAFEDPRARCPATRSPSRSPRRWPPASRPRPTSTAPAAPRGPSRRFPASSPRSSRATATSTSAASRATSSPARATTPTRTTSRASSPSRCRKCCPTATCWWPARKQIGINSNVDVLKFSGTIDPRHIRPGNTIASTQVANARIESRGRGAVDEALSIGWLGRFFLNVFPF
jgi:flagellar L-ring protein FlgH